MNSANNMRQSMDGFFSNLIENHTGLLFLITSLMLFGLGIYGLVVSINYGCGNVDPSKFKSDGSGDELYDGDATKLKGHLCTEVDGKEKQGGGEEQFCMQAGLMTCSIISIIIGIAMTGFAVGYMNKA